MGRASRRKADARTGAHTRRAEGSLRMADQPRPDWVHGRLSDEGWLVFGSLWDADLAARNWTIRTVLPDGRPEIEGVNYPDGNRLGPLGLDGIVRAVAQAPRREWPAMIRHHLDAITSILDPTILTPSVPTLRLRLSCGIRPDESIDVVGGGLTVALVHDLPTMVGTLTDPARVASDLGLSLDQLRDQARVTLRAALKPELTHVGNGLFFAEVTPGEEDYRASALLALTPEQMEAAGVDSVRGALVSVPSQQECVVAPIPAGDVSALFKVMGTITRDHYHDAIRPLFDHLLWWQGGRLQAVLVSELRGSDGEPLLIVVIPDQMLEAIGDDGSSTSYGLAAPFDRAA